MYITKFFKGGEAKVMFHIIWGASAEAERFDVYEGFQEGVQT